jgi:hypothetical protein
VEELYFNFRTPKSYKIEVKLKTPKTPLIGKQPREESKFKKRKKYNLKELNNISTVLFCDTDCIFSGRL